MKATQQEQQAYRWTADPLIGSSLRKPIVSDCRGTLYNKDAVIEFLLPAASEEANVDSKETKAEKENITGGCIRSLRDVVEVRFEVEDKNYEKTSTDDKRSGEIWKCPITNERLGPGAKAVYLVPCGHAYAQSVIKEVAGDRCLQVRLPIRYIILHPYTSIVRSSIYRGERHPNSKHF